MQLGSISSKYYSSNIENTIETKVIFKLNLNKSMNANLR